MILSVLTASHEMALHRRLYIQIPLRSLCFYKCLFVFYQSSIYNFRLNCSQLFFLNFFSNLLFAKQDLGLFPSFFMPKIIS